MAARDLARRRTVAALAWSLAVAALLLTPGDDLPSPGLPFLDKAAHALVFAIHFVLVARASGVRRRAGPAAAFAASVSGIYAAALEAAQIPIPGRSWELWDLVAGLAGIALAAALLARHRARVSAAD